MSRTMRSLNGNATSAYIGFEPPLWAAPRDKDGQIDHNQAMFSTPFHRPRAAKSPKMRLLNFDLLAIPPSRTED
jgi:hypothetical protein